MEMRPEIWTTSAYLEIKNISLSILDVYFNFYHMQVYFSDIMDKIIQ